MLKSTINFSGYFRENYRRNFPTVVGGPTAVPVLAVITAIFWHYRESPKSVPPKYEIPGTAKKVQPYFITARKLPPYFAVPGTAEIGNAKKLSIGNRQKNTKLKYYYTICVRREKTVPRKTLLYFEKLLPPAPLRSFY